MRLMSPPAQKELTSMENKRPAGGKMLLWFVLIQGAVLLFSTSSILIKAAGRYEMFSLYFFLLYFGALAIALVYAVIWQQILKKVSLTTAYTHRATGVIWSMVWGALLFSETISWNMIVGAVVIMAGLFIVVTAND